MAGVPQSRGLVSGNQLRTPRVELLGAQMSALADAIRTTQTLTGQPVTVIGGLAVICRLSSPHRATSDLDIVNRRGDHQTPQLELLIAKSEPVEGRNAALVTTAAGKVIVDVLEVADADLHPLPDDPTGRLFVLSHAWAAATATPVIIDVRGQPDIAVAVAEPGPLIAMKLQATFDRSKAKEGTDLLDIVRLTLDQQSGLTVREQLSLAESQLAQDIAQHVDFCLNARADRSLSLINAIPEGADLRLDDIHLAAELLSRALGH
jgi:hypothetical protein